METPLPICQAISESRLIVKLFDSSYKVKFQKIHPNGDLLGPVLGVKYSVHILIWSLLLGYNVFMEKVTRRNWWDRIDSNMVLGALPFRGEISKKVRFTQILLFLGDQGIVVS